MKNKVVKTLLLLSLIVLSCTKDNKRQILLQTGMYTFTISDFNILNTRTANRYSNPEMDDNLIDNAYIMAFALDSRYDTIGLLSKKIFYGKLLYSAEVNGYVWNKKVKPNLKVSSDEIKKAYNKRSNEYTIEFIGFPGGTIIDKLSKLTSNVNTEMDFYLLKQAVAATPEVTKGAVKGLYPFYRFSGYTDKICNAQKGAVLGPFETPNGIFMLHIADIRKVRQPDYNHEKSVIERELLRVMTDRYIQESQKDILMKANPQMDDKAILLMGSKFDSKTRQWSGIDDNMVLMNYQFKGKNQSFRAADLKELLNCKPVIMGSPSKANDLKEMMNNFLMDIYLYEEAKNMNAEADEDFIAFKRYYRNKLFVQHYKELYIYPKMKITPGEVQKFYDESKSNFIGFESATVLFFKFGDQQSAYNGLNPIKYFNGQNNQNPASLGLHPSNIPGMISVTEKNIINLSDTTNNVNLINAICEANEGQTLMPLKINEEFYVVHLKNKTGNAPLPFRYVKGKIEKILSEKKLNDAQNKQIAGLKAKYPLTINLLKEYNQKTRK